MKYLVCIFASVAALAQQQRPQAQDTSQTARIEGVVIASTGEAIPRAQVRLYRRAAVQNGTAAPTGNYSAITDDKGKFVIEGIEPAKLYNLEAQRPGFASGRYGAKSPSGPQGSFALDAGQSLTGITLTMTPQSVVSGRVIDLDDETVQGATVFLGRRVYQRGAWQLVVSSNASSDDRGEFRLANVLPGRYALIVSDRRNPDVTTRPTDKVSVPTYYPDAIDPSAMAYLDIGPGQDLTGLTMRIQKARVFSVRGQVTNLASAAGLTIVAVPRLETNTNRVIEQSLVTQLLRAQTRTNDDGTFELKNLVPGPYVVQAVATQGSSRGLGSVEFDVTNKNITDLVIPASGVASIKGTVRLEDGDLQKSLPDYNATTAQNSASTAASAAFAEAAVTGTRMAISLGDATPLPLTARPAAAVKPDGTFVIDNIAPSKYQLITASLPSGMYVKSARFGGADVTKKLIDLSTGVGGQIDIVLSNKAAAVSGVVIDEKGDSPPAIAVCLWPEEADLGMVNTGIRPIIVDQNGKFQFQGLRPGTYYAVAFEDIEWGIARERAFLKLLTNDSTKIELDENAQASIQVKIIPIPKLKTAAENLP